jgi:hypothetical protein
LVAKDAGAVVGQQFRVKRTRPAASNFEFMTAHQARRVLQFDLSW